MVAYHRFLVLGEDNGLINDGGEAGGNGGANLHSLVGHDDRYSNVYLKGEEDSNRMTL